MTDYSADEWIRTVEFPDTATNDHDVPIHVITRPVLINGEDRGYGALREEVVVSSSPGENGTMVSFVVYADDVEWTDYPIYGPDPDAPDPADGMQREHGSVVVGHRRGPSHLFGLRVLSPEGVDWDVYPARYHDHVAAHGKDDPGPTIIPGEVDGESPEPATVRVVFFARTVEFSARG